MSILRALTKRGGYGEKTGDVSSETRGGFFRRVQRSCPVLPSLGEGGSQAIEMRNRKSFFTTLLEPIRKRRAELAADKGEVLNLLRHGTESARQTISRTLAKARAAMGINYF